MTDHTNADDTSPTLEPIEDEPAFDRIVASTDTVLVCFCADWCRSYRNGKRVLEEFERDTDVSVVEVDVEDHPQIANRFEITSVPTVLVFDRGTVAGRFVDGVSRTDLSELLE
ncbi:thioredoxin family protein [Natrialbaceae archaeon A-gly3]